MAKRARVYHQRRYDLYTESMSTDAIVIYEGGDERPAAGQRQAAAEIAGASTFALPRPSFADEAHGATNLVIVPVRLRCYSRTGTMKAPRVR